MEITGKVWCFFEQSGTFKNEFKKLGYNAVDLDIQNNFKELTKNTLLAVILTSAFFSLMHFELYAFLPRFLLSLCLGLLLAATNNLWIPILCHFINNLCVCIFYYLHNLKIIPSPDSTTYSQHPILIILSGVILILFFFHLYKLKRRIK